MPEYEKMSPRKTMASGGSRGAGSSGLPKKQYSNKMDGDGAPKTKSEVASQYPQSSLLGKATAGGMDGDKDY